MILNYFWVSFLVVYICYKTETHEKVTESKNSLPSVAFILCLLIQLSHY
jgi:hypothetical protein